MYVHAIEFKKKSNNYMGIFFHSNFKWSDMFTTVFKTKCTVSSVCCQYIETQVILLNQKPFQSHAYVRHSINECKKLNQWYFNFLRFSHTFTPALFHNTCWSDYEICALIHLFRCEVAMAADSIKIVHTAFGVFVLFYGISLNSCTFKADLVYIWDGKNSYFWLETIINFKDNWIEITDVTDWLNVRSQWVLRWILFAHITYMNIIKKTGFIIERNVTLTTARKK